MSDGLIYRKDVEFLENCNPPLVERNADEFRRIQALLVAVAPEAERAEKHTEWRSEGSANYTARLTEGRRLVDELAEAYGHAAGALRRYAEALTLAKARCVRVWCASCPVDAEFGPAVSALPRAAAVPPRRRAARRLPVAGAAPARRPGVGPRSFAVRLHARAVARYRAITDPWLRVGRCLVATHHHAGVLPQPGAAGRPPVFQGHEVAGVLVGRVGWGPRGPACRHRPPSGVAAVAPSSVCRALYEPRPGDPARFDWSGDIP